LPSSQIIPPQNNLKPDFIARLVSPKVLAHQLTLLLILSAAIGMYLLYHVFIYQCSALHSDFCAYALHTFKKYCTSNMLAKIKLNSRNLVIPTYFRLSFTKVSL